MTQVVESPEIPWVEKYRPKTSRDLIGLQTLVDKLQKFLDDFFLQQSQLDTLYKALKNCSDPTQMKKIQQQITVCKMKLQNIKARLLIGPPGTGKTTIIYALANDNNLSVIELNASDTRTESILNEILSEPLRTTSLLSFSSKPIRGKLILMDEIDGLHGQSDRGGIAALQKLIKITHFPIIMTCNFRDEQKFKSLYSLVSPLIEIPQAAPADIATVLTSIATQEKIPITSDQILQIAVEANGDFRVAINDLQALTQGLTEIDADRLQKWDRQRDSEARLQEMMVKLFQAATIKGAKAVLDEIDVVDIDFRTIHRWINENLPPYISQKSDLLYAFQHLAFVDRILGYIGRTQDYAHLSYFYDILAGGVRFAKSDTTFPKMAVHPPRWFRLRAVPDDKITLLLQKLYRYSLNQIMREIKPALQIHLKYYPLLVPFLARLFHESEKDISQLLKGKID